MIVGITPYSCQTRTNFTASPRMLQTQMELLLLKEDISGYFLKIAKDEFAPSAQYGITKAVCSMPVEDLATVKRFIEEFTGTTPNLTQKLPASYGAPYKENQVFFEQIKRQVDVFTHDQKRRGISNTNYTISDCLQYNLMNLQKSFLEYKNHMEEFARAVNRILPIYEDEGGMKRLTIDFAYCLEDFIEAATLVERCANTNSLAVDVNRMIPEFLKVFPKASEDNPYCLNAYNFTDISQHPKKYIQAVGFDSTSIDFRRLETALLKGMAENKL